MVKTFEICAPSLNGGVSAIEDVKAFFKDKEFPLNVQLKNNCPFALIVPSLSCYLDANHSDERVARSLEELLRFVVTVEQIAFLNNVSKACVLCFADSSVIEEPEKVETPEIEESTSETEEITEEITVEEPTPHASMRKSRSKRTN